MNMREKQILTGVTEIQIANRTVDNYAFSKYNLSTIFVQSFKMQNNVWRSFPNICVSPQILHKHPFAFSWDHCNPKRTGNNAYAKFVGGGGEGRAGKQRVLWHFPKCLYIEGIVLHHDR